MARRKRSSAVLEKAERRALSLEAIAADLELGNGMSIETYRQRIDAMRATISSYNRMLSAVDQLYGDMMQQERDLSDLNVRMLAAVAAKYGRYSAEYETAGGSRLGENLRPRVAVAG
jgi:hypothetical protein